MGTKTVVITGGNGFVGRYLVTELKSQGAKVVVWDKDVKNLSSDIAGVEVDITKPETYQKSLSSLQPDWVVHLAAIASVSYAIAHPDVTQQVNVRGTQSLLQTVQQLSPVTNVLVVSSADIYGKSSPDPLPELSLSQCQPKNVYASSKLEMERMIEEAFLDRVIRVRPFPHIGPGQGLGFVTADFASQIAAIEADKQTPVIKVGNLTAQRDFTDVRDVVRAYRLLLENGKVGEVYNVASGRPVPVQTLLDTLLSFTNATITVEEDPERLRPSDTPILVGDASKLMNTTNWQPAIPLEKSLRDILDYWRKSLTS